MSENTKNIDQNLNMEGENSQSMPEMEIHKNIVPVDEQSNDDKLKISAATESAKDCVLDGSSKNSNENENENDKPVNREPPSYGSFTRFTIDHILSSSHSCKSNDSNTKARITISPDNEENLSHNFGTAWIYKSSPRSFGLVRNQDEQEKSFHFPSYEDNCPESLSSSESDDALLSTSAEHTGMLDRTEDSRSSPDTNHQSEYSWLHCTRYKPPKLPSKYIVVVTKCRNLVTFVKNSVILITIEAVLCF